MRASSLLLAVAAITGTVYSKNEVQFRCDYEYDPRSNRYYKYQEIPAAWDEAQLRCYLEGAILASPLKKQVTDKLTSLIARENFHNEGSADRILVGVAAKHSIGDFVTIEGVPLNKLTTAWSGSQPRIYENNDNSVSLGKDGRLSIQPARVQLPYVCYKHNSTVQPFRLECGTSDPEYELHGAHCYKFHRQPRIWSSAHLACRAEGGYLVIVNSKYESGILEEIFARNPADKIIGKIDKNTAHIGFSDWNEHGTWRTIDGESLEQAGFDQFSPGEPNNNTAPGPEFCGSVKRDGLLNDYACTNVATFICEKDPHELSTKGCILL